MSPKVFIDRVRLAEFCQRNHIRRLAVFGSALREDFGAHSDIDVLVEFEPGRTPGLAFFSMQDELGRLFNQVVDLHTPASLSRYFRDHVLSEAEDQYVAIVTSGAGRPASSSTVPERTLPLRSFMSTPASRCPPPTTIAVPGPAGRLAPYIEGR